MWINVYLNLETEHNSAFEITKAPAQMISLVDMIKDISDQTNLVALNAP